MRYRRLGRSCPPNHTNHMTDTTTTSTPAPAPVVNAPLAAAETPETPEVTPPPPSYSDAIHVVVSELKARLASTRPDILSAWGRYAQAGSVVALDRGVTLDAKRVPDLLKAAKARPEPTLVDACERYISAARALAALAKL